MSQKVYSLRGSMLKTWDIVIMNMSQESPWNLQTVQISNLATMDYANKEYKNHKALLITCA